MTMQETMQETIAPTKKVFQMFKTQLPLVLDFTHSISKSREYHGCPRITLKCEALAFKAVEVGYGYDMVGALLSVFINANCAQNAISRAADSGYNPIHQNKKTGMLRVELCQDDIYDFFKLGGIEVRSEYTKRGYIKRIILL